MENSIPYHDELERNFRIAHLIGHFIQENLTGEEEIELEKWIQQSDHNMDVFESLTDEATVRSFLKWYHEKDTERRLVEVKQRLPFPKPGRLIMLKRIAVAASLVLLMGTAIYFIGFHNRSSAPVTGNGSGPDIAPGQSMATLTLANGQKIFLGSAKDTVINDQVSIKNGIITYASAGSEPAWHEISIPRKGFYKLQLPDGSRVWINSASTIRYPSRFTGHERRVIATGETFFEVAKDPEHPFIVQVNNMDIRALGTAFNVNAYPEEVSVRTTLTHGSIKVSDKDHEKIIAPGEQLSAYPSRWVVSPVDIQPVTAWTNNEFRFRNNTIREVMRLVERWYDAKIEYKEEIGDHFTGTIERNVPVSQLLKLLEATGEVHFRIKNDVIIVSK